MFSSWVRCLTPKRCCSSVMVSRRSANSTPSEISACVPMTTCHSPLAIASRARRRSAAVMCPVSSRR
ncbi:MAG: hypothetical protein V8Q79_06900 [Christensenellales bacterium]